MIFGYIFVRGTRCRGLSVRVRMKVLCISMKIPIIFPKNNAQSCFKHHLFKYLALTSVDVYALKKHSYQHCWTNYKGVNLGSVSMCLLRTV